MRWHSADAMNFSPPGRQIAPVLFPLRSGSARKPSSSTHARAPRNRRRTLLARRHRAGLPASRREHRKTCSSRARASPPPRHGQRQNSPRQARPGRACTSRTRRSSSGSSATPGGLGCCARSARTAPPSRTSCSHDGAVRERRPQGRVAAVARAPAVRGVQPCTGAAGCRRCAIVAGRRPNTSGSTGRSVSGRVGHRCACGGRSVRRRLPRRAVPRGRRGDLARRGGHLHTTTTGRRSSSPCPSTSGIFSNASFSAMRIQSAIHTKAFIAGGARAHARRGWHHARRPRGQRDVPESIVREKGRPAVHHRDVGGAGGLSYSSYS